MIGRKSLRFVRYLIVGGTSAAAHFLTAWLLVHHFAVASHVAAAAGFGAGFVVSLYGHKLFTFRSTLPTVRIAPKMLALAAFGLIYNATLVGILVSWGFNADLAIFIGMLTTPIVNYAALRLWVFKRQS